MRVSIVGMVTTQGAAHLAHLRRMRLAKDAMDRDWAEPLDLTAVAAHAGYSRHHFIRAFAAVYGCTPGQYLTHRRIERAEELLRSANLSVTEICSLVGFSSLGTFSASFKRRTGLSPSAYRRRHVRQGAALIPGCYALLWYGGAAQRPTPPQDPVPAAGTEATGDGDEGGGRGPGNGRARGEVRAGER